ncbi:MAG: tetratricopeptide repeat protein, partial [Acidobacteriota bacterium]
MIALAMLVTPLSLTTFGQTTPSQAPAPAAAPRPQRPADEEALQNASSIKDPQARIEALIKYVSDYPRAPYIRNAAYYLTRGLKPMYTEPEKVRPLFNRFVEGTATATVYARTEFYYNIARDLLNNGILFDLAEDLARKGVALLDESAYITNERVGHEARESYYAVRDPKYKPETFSVAQATEKFRTFRALNHSTLGRAYLKTGKPEEAEKSLKQAQQIAPSMEAATALADLLEQRGKAAEALDYMGAAELTGRLPAAGVTRLHELYRKLNNGKLDGLEASLDARYRKNYRAPIKVEHYRSAKPRGDNPRSVLAEFITGAGCEPCISVDLSFDAELERYPRRDLVLMV